MRTRWLARARRSEQEAHGTCVGSGSDVKKKNSRDDLDKVLSKRDDALLHGYRLHVPTRREANRVRLKATANSSAIDHGAMQLHSAIRKTTSAPTVRIDE